MAVMPWGLLWYEAEGALEDKVRNAARRYKEKHGKAPTVCYVHPSLCSEKAEVDGCVVLSHPSVLKDHLWIGVANES